MSRRLRSDRMMRVIAAAVALVVVGGLAPSVAPAAPQQRASLTDIENNVMCVVCNTPLAVSQSPQADAERQFIRDLITKGETKAQIERALVAQYGPSVLALPPAHGFNLTVYVVPPAILLVGLAALALVLPRWRRRTRAAASAAESGTSPPPPLDAAEARRLDEDLARHGP